MLIRLYEVTKKWDSHTLVINRVLLWEVHRNEEDQNPTNQCYCQCWNQEHPKQIRVVRPGEREEKLLSNKTWLGNLKGFLCLLTEYLVTLFLASFSWQYSYINLNKYLCIHPRAYTYIHKPTHKHGMCACIPCQAVGCNDENLDGATLFVFISQLCHLKKLVNLCAPPSLHLEDQKTP